MFKGCSNLRYINLSGFNTGKVTSMAHMFDNVGYSGIKKANKDGNYVRREDNYYYTEIVGLADESFDTRDVTDMSYMFYLCSAKTLDVSKFKPYNVTDFSYMFAGYSPDYKDYWCTKFENLDLKNWKVGSKTGANPINLKNMFEICLMVTSLAFTPEENPANEQNNTAWNFSRVTSMSNMFDRAESLTKVVFPKHTDLTNVTTLLNVFNHDKFIPRTKTEQEYGSLEDILNRWDIRNNDYTKGKGGKIDFSEPPYDRDGKGNSKNRLVQSTAIQLKTELVTYTYGESGPGTGPEVNIGGSNLGSDTGQQCIKKTGNVYTP